MNLIVERIDSKEDFIGRYFLCLTELDYKDLISRLSMLGFEWAGSESPLTDVDLDKWGKMGSSTVVWVSAKGVVLLGYFEVKVAGVEIETWNLA